MKSLILHIHDDAAMEGRLQVALDLARAYDAHITCVQAMPVQDYVAGEPLGGFYATGVIVDEVRAQGERVRADIEDRLGREDVRWDWIDSMDDVASALLTVSALADLLIVSQSSGAGEHGPIGIVDSLAARTSCAVLAVPAAVTGINPRAPIAVAWNGSVEAAHALRQALPMLGHAERVDIIAIGADRGTFSHEAASTYLARHGIASELHLLNQDAEPVAHVLDRVAVERGAGALLIGAYGHSRLREAIFGGVTRDLIGKARIPLLIGH